MFLWTFDSSPQNSNFITVTQNFSAEGNVSLRAKTPKDFLVNLNFSIILFKFLLWTQLSSLTSAKHVE